MPIVPALSRPQAHWAVQHAGSCMSISTPLCQRRATRQSGATRQTSLRRRVPRARCCGGRELCSLDTTHPLWGAEIRWQGKNGIFARVPEGLSGQVAADQASEADNCRSEGDLRTGAGALGQVALFGSGRIRRGTRDNILRHPAFLHSGRIIISKRLCWIGRRSQLTIQVLGRGRSSQA
jgi:hypothetical protein